MDVTTQTDTERELKRYRKLPFSDVVWYGVLCVHIPRKID